MTASVTAEYLMGLQEGRERLDQCGPSIAQEELDGIQRAIRGFSAGSPVGQMLRGERDFWVNQLNRNPASTNKS